MWIPAGSGLLIEQVVAGMFVEKFIRDQRPSCECIGPIPGSWSVSDWTTCQQCGRQLARYRFIEARSSTGFADSDGGECD